jgi:hypothetical protein
MQIWFDHLRELAAAVVADMDDTGGVSRHHRQCERHGLGRPSAHDRELPAFSARLAARNRGIDRVQAVGSRRFRKPPRKPGGGGGVIDEDRALTHVLEGAVRADRDLFHVMIRADAGNHGVRAARGCGRRRSEGAAMFRHPVPRLVVRAVEDRNRMPCPHEVPRHWRAHHPEPDETDPCHGTRDKPCLPPAPDGLQPPPMAAQLPVTLEDIRAAARRIEGSVVRTPTLLSRTLSEVTGATVYVKFENLQFTAAYKERGALNKLLQMEETTRAQGRDRGLCRQSCAGGGLSRRPARRSRHNRDAEADPLRSSHADGGPWRDDRAARRDVRRSLCPCPAARTGARPYLRPPVRRPQIIAGQGTVALEMLEDAPGIETMLVPIGGGGLISGVAIAAKALRPGIEVIGAQAELYPSMYCRFTGNDMPSSGDTIAEGIAVKSPGTVTGKIIDRVVDEILLVPSATWSGR